LHKHYINAKRQQKVHVKRVTHSIKQITSLTRHCVKNHIILQFMHITHVYSDILKMITSLMHKVAST